MFDKGQSASYFLREYDVRKAQIPIGTLNFVTEPIFNSTIPTYLLVGLVDSGGFNGALNKSGFFFDTCDLTSIAASSDKNALMYRQIKVDYNSNLYIQAYHSIFAALRPKETGNFIDRDRYKAGNCLYLFELISNPSNCQLQQAKFGHLKVFPTSTYIGVGTRFKF